MTALTAADRDWLAKAFAGNVVFDEPMAGHTTFRVGGPAEALVSPGSTADLVSLVQWTDARGIGCLPFGAGSNTLVSDLGIPGVVVLLGRCLREIRISDADTGLILRRSKSAEPRAASLDVSADGRLLATAGNGKLITIWDTGRLQPLHRLNAQSDVKKSALLVMAVSYSPS